VIREEKTGVEMKGPILNTNLGVLVLTSSIHVTDGAHVISFVLQYFLFVYIYPFASLNYFLQDFLDG
jgi:hypothetical protein